MMHIKLLLILTFSLFLSLSTYALEEVDTLSNKTDTLQTMEHAVDTTFKGRSKVAIREVVMDGASGLKNIYNRYLIKEPNLRGKIIIEIVIAPSGEVISASVVESSINKPLFERDIVATIKSWNFGSVPKGVATVIYSFSFPIKVMKDSEKYRKNEDADGEDDVIYSRAEVKFAERNRCCLLW